MNKCEGNIENIVNECKGNVSQGAGCIFFQVFCKGNFFSINSSDCRYSLIFYHTSIIWKKQKTFLYLVFKSKGDLIVEVSFKTFCLFPDQFLYDYFSEKQASETIGFWRKTCKVFYINYKRARQSKQRTYPLSRPFKSKHNSFKEGCARQCGLPLKGLLLAQGPWGLLVCCRTVPFAEQWERRGEERVKSDCFKRLDFSFHICNVILLFWSNGVIEVCLAGGLLFSSILSFKSFLSTMFSSTSRAAVGVVIIPLKRPLLCQ